MGGVGRLYAAIMVSSLPKDSLRAKKDHPVRIVDKIIQQVWLNLYISAYRVSLIYSKAPWLFSSLF